VPARPESCQSTDSRARAVQLAAAAIWCVCRRVRHAPDPITGRNPRPEVFAQFSHVPRARERPTGESGSFIRRSWMRTWFLGRSVARIPSDGSGRSHRRRLVGRTRTHHPRPPLGLDGNGLLRSPHGQPCNGRSGVKWLPRSLLNRLVLVAALVSC